MSIEIEPIAIIHSPFKEKFGTPRQPGIIENTRLAIEMLPPYDSVDAFEGLTAFSHLWIIFLFHNNRKKDWSPKVRPPRLGGNERIGVFASRAPYRPNSLGLSVVRLRGVRREEDKLYLDIQGGDMVEGTPVIDIKPYIPYADCVPDAEASYASSRPKSKLKVVFSPTAQAQLGNKNSLYPDLELLIRQVLEQDPRPAYHRKVTNKAEYGMKLYDFEIKWQVQDSTATVLSLEHSSLTNCKV